eukprot:gene5970-12043_t
MLLVLFANELWALNVPFRSRLPVQKLSMSISRIPNVWNISPKSAGLIPAIILCFSPIFLPVSTLAASGNDAIDLKRVMQEPSVVRAPIQESKNVQLPSGLIYYDNKIGDGAAAEEGKTVQFQWVLRRSNGYFVDASSNYNNEPFIYRVGNTKKVISGVDEGIRGMKVGGVRRLLIPPQLAFVQGVGDDKPGPMPNDFGPRRQISTRLDKETWYFEIQLVKVR